MVYLVGSIALRMMALAFLFPVVSKLTLAAVRPGYFDEMAARSDFAFLIGFDVVLVIVGLLLLFRSSAETLLGYVESRAIAILRAIIMSSLTAVAILLCMGRLAYLGVIESLDQNGVLPLAIGFWIIFFVCCIFPGWYRRKLWVAETPDADRPLVPTYTPQEARFLRLTHSVHEPLSRHERLRHDGGSTGHMDLRGWLVTLSTLVLFGGIVTGGAHGLSKAQFLPSDAYMRNVDAVVLPLGILCAVLLILFTAIGPRPRGKTALGSPFWRTVAAVAVFYVGFYVCAEPALRFGLPDFHAQFYGGSERSIPARVVARDKDYRRHRCDRTVYVQMDVGQGMRRYLICNIPPDIWTGLARDQQLIVRGKITAYGFHYVETVRG